MSSVHLFADDRDEFEARWMGQGARTCEIQVGQAVWLTLRREHVEKLHAVLGEALAAAPSDQDGSGATGDHG